MENERLLPDSVINYDNNKKHRNILNLIAKQTSFSLKDFYLQHNEMDLMFSIRLKNEAYNKITVKTLKPLSNRLEWKVFILLGAFKVLTASLCRFSTPEVMLVRKLHSWRCFITWPGTMTVHPPHI